jgi:hypothetical protein
MAIRALPDDPRTAGASAPLLLLAAVTVIGCLGLGAGGSAGPLLAADI